MCTCIVVPLSFFSLNNSSYYSIPYKIYHLLHFISFPTRYHLHSIILCLSRDVINGMIDLIFLSPYYLFLFLYTRHDSCKNIEITTYVIAWTDNPFTDPHIFYTII